MGVVVSERADGSRRVQFVVEGESKVEESHKGECDINKLMKKALRTGLFPQRTDDPTYGDFTGVDDYHSAMNRLKAAQEDFLTLPSDIRARFKNDPGELVEFLNDPANLAEAEDLGLVEKIGVDMPLAKATGEEGAAAPEEPPA